MEVKKWLIDLLKKRWKEGRILTEWKTSLVVPFYKKGDKERTENYRDISLLCTSYKIYAELLRNRLEDVIMSKKEMLPESQVGFRKGRSIVDNIFVLNHIIQREKMKVKEENKMYALFVDLKAAFDNVDREKL